MRTNIKYILCPECEGHAEMPLRMNTIEFGKRTIYRKCGTCKGHRVVAQSIELKTLDELGIKLKSESERR